MGKETIDLEAEEETGHSETGNDLEVVDLEIEVDDTTTEVCLMCASNAYAREVVALLDSGRCGS